MAISFSGTLGFHPQLLSLQAERVTVYGSNLINAETPEFRAADFDVAFEQELLALKTTDSRHLSSNYSGTPRGVFTKRPQMQTMLNGNSVDVPLEQAAIGRTLADYSVNMSFIRYHLSALSAAVNGR